MTESTSNLRDLLQSGLPEHPFSDLEDQLEQLTELAVGAREQKQREDDELLHEAGAYLDRLEAEIETVGDQIRRLSALHEEFGALGPYGAQGSGKTRDLMTGLREYEERLRRRLEEPSLQEAKAQRRQWRQQKVDEIRATLESGLTPAVLEDVVSDLVQLATGDDWGISTELMESLEHKVRESFGIEMLAPVQRFWNQMRKRVGDPGMQEKARSRARAIREELSEWEETKEANKQVGVLCGEVHNGIKYIDRLGPEEQIAQIHIWLGKMRRYQDQFELDHDSENRLYVTFGAIGRLQKQLQMDHYFDGLNRKFSTEWDTYIATWQGKLEDARVKDKLDREARLEREAREAEQARLAEEAEKKKAAQLQSVLAALEDPLDDSEARDLLEIGVESGGCQSEEFLRLAAPYSRLAYGTSFRGLRRSLKKYGIDDDAIGTDEPPSVDPYEEVYARLRKSYENKKVLIIGGLPVESRRRQLEEGLGLSELRWYEHYRETTKHREAEAAIKSGEYSLAVFLVRFSSHKANDLYDLCRQLKVPAEKVDRGCGVTALLRAFESRAA